METILYKCDQCGKASTDYYREEGWVIIGSCVILTHGREGRGNAVTGYMGRSSEYPYHFCSFKCFESYMKRIKPDGSLKKKE